MLIEPAVLRSERLRRRIGRIDAGRLLGHVVEQAVPMFDLVIARRARRRRTRLRGILCAPLWHQRRGSGDDVMLAIDTGEGPLIFRGGPIPSVTRVDQPESPSLF